MQQREGRTRSPEGLNWKLSSADGVLRQLSLLSVSASRSSCASSYPTQRHPSHPLRSAALDGIMHSCPLPCTQFCPMSL